MERCLKCSPRCCKRSCVLRTSVFSARLNLRGNRKPLFSDCKSHSDFSQTRHIAPSKYRLCPWFSHSNLGQVAAHLSLRRVISLVVDRFMFPFRDRTEAGRMLAE